MSGPTLIKDLKNCENSTCFVHFVITFSVKATIAVHLQEKFLGVDKQTLDFEGDKQ